jgi:hypothetical protein
MNRTRSSVLALALAVGCNEGVKLDTGGVELEDLDLYPEAGSSLCASEAESAVTGQTFGRLGSEVTFLSTGDASDEGARLFAAATQPGAPASVALHAVASDGTLSSTVQRLPVRSAAAIAGVDIRAGAGTSKYGDELLVGVTSTPTALAGVLYWYQANTAGTFTLGGSIVPAGGVSGDRFGEAVAASGGASAGSADWVAVGSPGADAVYIYDVLPRSASPLSTLVQTLTAPASLVGMDFGGTLTVGDFDDDGVDDLAVGAPVSSVAGGTVLVYRGSTAVAPFSTDPLELAYGGGSIDDEFGAALATGSLFGGALRDALAVGAPSYDDGASTDEGRVCQYLLEGDTGAASGLGTAQSSCGTWSSAAAGDRFGEALAIGDFHPLDALGQDTGPAAGAQELAVGAPGVTSEMGVVVVLAPTEDGATFGDPLGEIYAASPATGSRFGATLAAAYAQDQADHPSEDLLIGAPYDGAQAQGSVTLTKAVAAEVSVTGLWTGTDSAGGPLELRLADNGDGTLDLVVVSDYYVAVEDGANTVCTPGGTAAEVTVDADEVASFSSWDPATGTNQIMLKDEAEGRLWVELQVTGSNLTLAYGGDGLWVTLMAADCDIPDFLLTQEGTTCD